MEGDSKREPGNKPIREQGDTLQQAETDAAPFRQLDRLTTARQPERRFACFGLLKKHNPFGSLWQAEPYWSFPRNSPPPIHIPLVVGWLQ